MSTPQPAAVPAPPPGSGGALGAVLTAVRGGAATPEDLSRATGLDRDLVAVALDTLTRLGHLERGTAPVGCPAGGCTGCAAPTGHGCATPGAGSRGLVMLTLGRRPPPAG
ncbi:MAG: hypothetical protein GC157_05040 [Frankiales bacterium]|nr:hypothetical protein [Frankiales bacterium]